MLANGPAISGRPGADHFSSQEDRSARPVHCIAWLCNSAGPPSRTANNERPDRHPRRIIDVHELAMLDAERATILPNLDPRLIRVGILGSLRAPGPAHEPDGDAIVHVA